MIKKLLAFLFLMSLLTGTVSAKEITLSNIRITLAKNTIYQLKSEDIASAVEDQFMPDAVKITKLPPATSGEILKNGHAVTKDEIIPSNDFASVTFQPYSDFLGEVSFSFQVISGTRLSNEGVFTLEYIAVPTTVKLQDLYYGTEKNIAREMPLYPANYEGHLQLVIPALPKHGQVIAKDENYHMVVYVPNQDYVGEDSFTYQELGNEENTATVHVTVSEPVTPLPVFVHEDLKNHWVNYSAGNLADRGILHGEMVGGKYYFHPDTKMTRWEFLNYLLASAGFSIDSAQLGYADRYEDAHSLPEYIRKIAALATQMGILEGVKEGDALYIYPYQELTRAQAVTMVGKLIASDAESEDKLYFTDREDIPSWARKHFINLVNFRILQGYPDNTIRPYASLNKAQTAEMLYQSVKLTEKEPQILRQLKRNHQYYQ